MPPKKSNVAAKLDDTPSVESKVLTQPKAMIIVALIGLIPAIITGLITWNAGKPKREMSREAVAVSAAAARLDDSLRAPSGFQKKIYPNLGFGFIAPKAWQVEDYTTRFGIADIDVVQRYTEAKAVIGVGYNLVPVQPNYVNDINQEISNQSHVWEKIDPGLQVVDDTIAGFPAKRFDYTQKTGKRVGQIRTYWVRILPEVKLQIACFTYTDEPDQEQFWKDAQRVVESTQVDRELLELRRKLER